MKVLPALLLMLLGQLPTSGSTPPNPILGTWRVDTVATAAYLKAHKIIPDRAIEKLMPVTAQVGWRFDEGFIYSIDNPESGPVPYRIVARSENRIVLSADYEDGTVSWVIELEGDAYWQAGDKLVKGYKERVVRVQEDRPNKRPDGASTEAPPSKPSQGAAVPHP